MRLRRHPLARQILSTHPLVIQQPEESKGQWETHFPSKQPLYIELGTGKGQFLAKAAELHPHINWIGVEKIEEPLMYAVQKGEATECTNLRYVWMDITKLEEIFAPGEEVDRIYLHFSDPWPKTRHAKRRLTHHTFLDKYRNVLKPDGDLILKTDSVSLFDFSLEELETNGWNIVEISRDLHQSEWANTNITTEYEEKFSARGFTINYVRAYPPRRA
ncbi:tRNA (guanosine(46)-N7)-methyltransferase TrmB [Thermoactinomyces sp. DSM 45892]|uniref:tRNA (guanosine(46)-N7)-methyltransferase TrmB n=1 Tax=Thermoactinomyces sp. DSM 45892 TaxID=1882753 RepID=UPI00089BA1F9|nr:tRNA (guanosine(46)-N7)-methyltransferase TrmB [Thermoactinomyces sp. DSM 45892]SDY27702.1 tRNA (guanine-N7-)-methyltransferase [Thermoactinomyces sp. DSM 45892]